MKKNKKIKKKIVCAIACRLNSTRLFGKPLQLINNKTILELQINQLKKSKLIDEIVLAISKEVGNEVFIDFAKKKKIKYITGDEKNVSKRLEKAAKLVNADVIFRTTSEDPLKFWQIFDEVIKSHIKNNADITFPKKLPEGSGFEIFNLKSLQMVIKYGNKKELEHVTPLILKSPNKFRINVFSVSKEFRRPEIRLTIDNPEDLMFVREIFKKISLKSKIPDLQKAIMVYDKFPELRKINKKFVNKNRKWL